MREIAAAVLEAVRSSISPVQAGTDMADPAPSEYVRLRSSSSEGPLASMPGQRAGLLFVDIWTTQESRLHEIEDSLMWLAAHDVSVHGKATGLRYKLASRNALDEPTHYRLAMIFEVVHFDMRIGA